MSPLIQSILWILLARITDALQLADKPSAAKWVSGHGNSSFGMSSLETEPARRGLGWSDWGWFGSIHRQFLGADPIADENICLEDNYEPSRVEQDWHAHVVQYTDDSHCSHLPHASVNAWILQNKRGSFDPRLFSKLCRKGRLPQFIEPLAGILRDPRFACHPYDDDYHHLLSVDWLVFPGSRGLLSPGTKARFYDAGGSHFADALYFFLETYKGHGIIFDEVYVWEHLKQGTEEYWSRTPPEIRAFWEARVTFYNGIGVVAKENSPNNPVSRIYKDCKPEDFCVFKLDIDVESIESPLTQQLLQMQDETKAKLDEFFFEHHVQGPMAPWWGSGWDGTFADSYNLFSRLRNMGVRAHSWV